MSMVAIGFDLESLTLPVDKILPSRKTPVGMATSRKFIQIRSSIQEIGLIEPLSVGPADLKTGQHVLLDGHIRLITLLELKYSEVPCLVATDDESFSRCRSWSYSMSKTPETRRSLISTKQAPPMKGSRVITDFRGVATIIWEQLFPAEQTRIVKLLIEKVIVSPTNIELRLRANGIEQVVMELQPAKVGVDEEVAA